VSANLQLHMLSMLVRFNRDRVDDQPIETSLIRFVITGAPVVAGGGVIMPKAFVIEVRSRTAGIVVHDGRRYRFYAAAHEFNGLEGRDFRSPNDAQKAAVGHMATLDSKTGGSGLPGQHEIWR
jgi:hypothetical protein